MKWLSVRLFFTTFCQQHIFNNKKKNVEEPTRWDYCQVNTEWLSQCVVEILNSAQVYAVHRHGETDANFIGYKKDIQNIVTLLLCKIQDLQDPTTTCSSWIQDSPNPPKFFCPRSKIPIRFHGNVAVIGSKISKIPWENKSIKSNILQDPESWGSRISDPFGILAHACMQPCILLHSISSDVPLADAQNRRPLVFLLSVVNSIADK